MPVYEYECENCCHRFELKQSFEDDPVVTCPQCQGSIRRIFSPVPIIFKGQGFYVTDKLAEERNRLGHMEGEGKPAGAKGKDSHKRGKKKTK